MATGRLIATGLVAALLLGGCAPRGASPYRQELARKQREESVMWGVVGTVVGAGLGAAVGAVAGSPGLGAAVGAALGAATGVSEGSKNALQAEQLELEKERLELEKERWRKEAEELKEREVISRGSKSDPA